MSDDFEMKLIDDLLYKIELDKQPTLDDSEWLLIIEALEYYKESFNIG